MIKNNLDFVKSVIVVNCVFYNVNLVGVNFVLIFSGLVLLLVLKGVGLSNNINFVGILMVNNIVSFNLSYIIDLWCCLVDSVSVVEWEYKVI